jgi:demethylmenaquinone methyltransferase/2-methoxy-6-polyprenyl-1,4-benzoquinol methylase
VKDLVEEQKEYYAARAAEYDDWWYRRGRYELEPDALARWWDDVAEADTALEAFGPRGSVLELAAGTGIWTRKLVRTADRVVAVDANREPLALNTDEAEHVVADLFAWRPEEMFDVVFFSFWLSHVPDVQLDDFWTLVRSALKPGGRVFLVDNNVKGDPVHKGRTRVDTGVERRQLSDGREFDIVKHYRTPDDFPHLDLHVTMHGHFIYGGGTL